MSMVSHTYTISQRRGEEQEKKMYPGRGSVFLYVTFPLIFEALYVVLS